MSIGYIAINILGALMVITSLVILFMKTPGKSAVAYAVQAAILVALLFTMGAITDSPELYEWGTTAIFTKIILIPVVVYLLLRQLKKSGWSDSSDAPLTVKPWIIILVTIAIIVLNFFVVWAIEMPEAQNVKPLLAMSMSIFFIGILGVLSWRNLFKQIFCYCIMENSAHMAMAVLSPTAPSLMESGVATDAVFGTIIFAILIYRIYKAHKSLDADDLEELKG
ncbi:MAG: hydrogenase 4 membrane subunit [Eggerthellaceae bacterium]|nr:hydrogenase 4 membrane subunit [Eggerthellaceae bacterium]